MSKEASNGEASTVLTLFAPQLDRRIEIEIWRGDHGAPKIEFDSVPRDRINGTVALPDTPVWRFRTALRGLVIQCSQISPRVS